MFEIYGRVALTGKPEKFEKYVEALKMWFSISVFSPQKEHFVAVFDVITERKLLEETQSFLLQRGYPDEDFFASLARYLAQSLAMDYVCIDRLLGDRLTAQTVAIYFDGKFEDNVEYALKDTPCGDVVGKTICCFPRDVRHLFPQDVVLQEMVAESYVGTTLWSSKGQPIGLIAVLSRKPLVNPRLAESILKLVAVRAAGELERRQAEEELKERTHQLENANKELESFSYSVSHDLRAPLRAIDGYSKMILRQQRDKFDESTKHQFDVIRNNAKMMGQLIDDLLALSRLGGDVLLNASDPAIVRPSQEVANPVLARTICMFSCSSRGLYGRPAQAGQGGLSKHSRWHPRRGFGRSGPHLCQGRR